METPTLETDNYRSSRSTEAMVRIAVVGVVVMWQTFVNCVAPTTAQTPGTGSDLTAVSNRLRGSTSSAHIYWTGVDTTDGSYRNAIFRFSLADASVDTIVSADLLSPASVAVDTLSGRIYWTDNGAALRFRIMRANTDGSNIEEVVNTGACGIASLTDIELDLIGGQIYWALNGDCGGTDLQRADLDGSNLQYDLLGTQGILEYPEFITLDPINQFIYWDVLSTTPEGIGRVHFDATGLENVVADQHSWGLELDPVSQTLYWATGSSIYRTALDEVRVEEILTSDGDPKDLALDLVGGVMYWSETNRGAIRRANLDGSEVEDILDGLYRPLRLSIDFGGKVSVATEEPGNLEPRELNLRNYPNPFASVTRFTFELPTPAEATLEIYDIMGRRVAGVASGLFAIGNSTVEWNPAGLGKGLYFGRLSSEGHSATIPVIIQ